MDSSFLWVFALLQTIWLVYLSLRIDSAEAEAATYRNYFSDLAFKHNLVSTQVAVQKLLLASLIESDYITKQTVIQFLNKFRELNESLDSMKPGHNDWDNGNSWKNGFRPDGSRIDDDEENE